MQAKENIVARNKAIYKVTIIGSIGNLLLLIFKFIAGVLGHSSAMIADAVHSMSDFITDVIVMVFVRISSKPQDNDHAYGHGKYETLATAIIGILLMIVGFGIMYDSATKIIRCVNGEQLEAPGMIALWAALISIAVKEVLYQITARVGRRYDSKVVVANAWHHRSDAFSSIGTAVGIGGSILLGQHWVVLDPIAAIVVSLFIIKVSWSFIKPCVDELLEQALPLDQQQKIIDAVAGIPEMSEPHNLRTRSIGPYASVELHVRMDSNMTVGQSHELTRRLERDIKDALGERTYVNIHVEPIKELADNKQKNAE